MDTMSRTRYVRWQNYRIQQLAFNINLFLTFATASLAYVINLKLTQQPPIKICLAAPIVFWSLSAVFGCVAMMTKLCDYRHTARKIKESPLIYSFSGHSLLPARI
jgi:uncharacterized membrane protein YesL